MLYLQMLCVSGLSCSFDGPSLLFVLLLWLICSCHFFLGKGTEIHRWSLKVYAQSLLKAIYSIVLCSRIELLGICVQIILRQDYPDGLSKCLCTHLMVLHVSRRESFTNATTRFKSEFPRSKALYYSTPMTNSSSLRNTCKTIEFPKVSSR